MWTVGTVENNLGFVKYIFYECGDGERQIMAWVKSALYTAVACQLRYLSIGGCLLYTIPTRSRIVILTSCRNRIVMTKLEKISQQFLEI